MIWDNKYKRQFSTLQSFLDAKDIPIGSNIWKNVTRNRDLIAKGVKWKVGKGNLIKLWEGSWLFDSPLSDSPDWGKFQDQCKDNYGTMVGDYWNVGQWKDLSPVDPSLGNLNKIMNSMVVVDDDDQVIWKLTANGKFFVASLYNQQVSNLESPCWLRLG